MNAEKTSPLERRAAVHGALGDVVRLQMVEALSVGDRSPSELQDMLGVSSNLLAHHLKVLRGVGLIASRRSQGDGRRQYVRLVDSSFVVAEPLVTAPERVVFVCTANSARSHLAAALWERASVVPAASAGTHPATRVAPGAVDVADRHGLSLGNARPQALEDVLGDGDLVVTVCDLAHEEIGRPGQVHWSIPDPLRPNTREAYDTAYAEIEGRVGALAARFAS